MFVPCPECAAKIELHEELRLSEIVDCPACHSELEAVATDPPVLALAPEPEED
ncbi:MAG: lysine biosynthesis protein LysW, partial [Trebonia sp.]